MLELLVRGSYEHLPIYRFMGSLKKLILFYQDSPAFESVFEDLVGF